MAKQLKIEISFHESRFNRNIGRMTVEGFEANALNPEDFGYTQIYSGRCDSEDDAVFDIKSRFPNVEVVKVL